MMDNKLVGNVSNEELKQQLMENPDFAGGWTGEDRECTFFGLRRDLEAQELTMLFQNSDGLDEIVYIALMPSVEPRHYDAWMRKPGEDCMTLVLHCKAADLHEMHHQLMLRLPELQMI